MTAAYPLIARNLIKLTLNSAILVLLLVGQGWAQSPEFCGDGIDDSLATGGAAAGTKGSCPAGYHDALIGNGCDADCTTDKDGDGYTTTDCDDTRADVMPGYYIPNSFTSPTGYRLCQTNGTYGSTILTSVTPLCESTGSGVCRYLDCGNSLAAASDANPGTSYSAPKLTLASAIATLTPGSVLYFIGTGTCSETVSTSTTGTSGTGIITIKNYPGATAKIVSSSSTNGAIALTGSADFYKFDNLDIDPTHIGIELQGGSNDVEISRTYFHDLSGNGDNNGAFIRATSTNRTNFHHNFFRDALRGSGNVVNIAAIDWLDTSGLGGGADHVGKYNVCWFSSYSAVSNGVCWLIKHGVTAAEAGTNGHIVYNNTAINYGGGLVNGTSKLRARYNRFWAGADTVGAFGAGDIGGSAVNDDMEFKYNTIVRGGDALVTWNPMYTGAESLEIDHNIIIDTDFTYTAGNGDGVIKIDTYGSDAQKVIVDGGQLISNYNCFYSPNATAVFDYFGQNLGAGGHGPAGNAGGRYSFASWQSTLSQDANSYLQDPGTSAPKHEATGNCATFGWSQTPFLDATPTPTPTPSTNLPSVFPR